MENASVHSLIEKPRDDVFTLCLAEKEARKMERYPLVTATEQEYISAANSSKRKKTFALGRTVLRLLVGNILERTPEDIDVGIRDDGSIYLTGDDGHISLSHTGNLAAAVYSETPVGIDIEEVRKRRDDLYTYVLHPDEYFLLDEIGVDRNQATILFWTMKEAVLKGRRSGLRHSPKKIRLTLGAEHGSASAIADDGDEWKISYRKSDQLLYSVAYK